MRAIIISAFALLILATQIFAQIPGDLAAVEACGLKGAFAKRVSSCEKIYGADATIQQIYISREAANNPLGGIDDDGVVQWRLVSLNASKNALWHNVRTNMLWTLFTDKIEESKEPNCQDFIKKNFELKLFSFEFATENELNLARDQGLKKLAQEAGDEFALLCAAPGPASRLTNKTKKRD